MMSSPGHHENGSMSSSSAPSSITSTTYPSVTHKKVEGTVILTDSGMTFYPATVGAPAATPMLWTAISKHQVSPLSHPKNLLKVILNASPDANNPNAYCGSPAPSLPSSQSTSSFTFQLKSRGELERIRRDITSRLGTCRRILAQNAAPSTTTQSNNRKRSFHDAMSLSSPVSNNHNHSIASPINPKPMMMESEYSSSTFTTLSPTTMAVTRSSILSSDATLRLQHSLLATNQNHNNSSSNSNSNPQNSPTISEDDFWSTHAQNLSTTAAKIHGLTARGHPSTLKSSLDLLPGKIKIGVEEMRQIFILYPAVHRAYEKKVPLELSEEQFWRKYLESEYFHRDRGRLGSHVGKVMSLERMEKEKMDASRNDKDGAGGGGDDGTGDNDKKDDSKDDSNNNNNNNDTNEDEQNKNKSSKEQEENARVAAASSDDIFSRTDVELQRTNSERLAMWKKRIGIDLAVGQFDLAATANTERGGKLLLNAQDLHPGSTNSSRSVATGGRSSKGSLVIDKYNRHWAMVLNPEEATAGCALMSLARQSVHHVLPDDDDAKVSGGVRKEMQRLIGYANASEDRVDHVKGMGDGGPEDGGVLFEELKLINIGAYSGESVVSGKHNGGVDGNDGPARGIAMMKKELEQKRHFAHIMAEKVKIMVAPILESNWDNDKVGGKNGNGNTNNAMLPDLEHAFPDSTFGRQLLSALTKRMALDAMTEADAVKMANKLPEDFKKRLSLFFRRSSELLRHFFALRHVIEENKFTLTANNNTNDTGADDIQSSNKLKKIVKGMEGVYEEMEVVRKELPQTEIGENMRKMCLPIMEQLDSAFKLHRSSGSGGGGFGFVSVD